MEHKLIQGGEQFLPFARSRIKALKATGLKYASQKFEIDGVSIRVRIAGEHEYIELEGSAVKILSGAIKVGEIITIPANENKAEHKVLRSFRPTQNCWDFPLKKKVTVPVGSFSDLSELGYEPNSATQPGSSATQYRDIKPSMFSGEMAAVVQMLLGQRVPITYKMSFALSHGVVRGSDGKPWLVEISAARGVLAMPLPIAKSSYKGADLAKKEAVTLFGGVPTGGSFPQDDKLEEAITQQKVIRLLLPADLAPLLGKTSFSTMLGMSFGPTGAFNTCWSNASGTVTGFLYRIQFSLGAQKDMVGSAAITLVEQGSIFSKTGDDCVLFYQSPSFYAVAPGTIVTSYADSSAPVLARHIEGQLDIIRVATQAALTTDVTTGDTGAWALNTRNSYSKERRRVFRFESRGLASSVLGTTLREDQLDSSESDAYGGEARIFGGGQGTMAFRRDKALSSLSVVGPAFRRGVWNPGERDGILVIEGANTRSTNASSSTGQPESVVGGVYTYPTRAAYPSIALDFAPPPAPVGTTITYDTGSGLPGDAAFFPNPLSVGLTFPSSATGNAYLNSANENGAFDSTGESIVWFQATSVGPTQVITGDPNGSCTYHHANGEKTKYSYAFDSGYFSSTAFASLQAEPPFITACSMLGPNKQSYVVDLSTGLFPQGLNTFHKTNGSLFSGLPTTTDEEFNFTGFLG